MKQIQWMEVFLLLCCVGPGCNLRNTMVRPTTSAYPAPPRSMSSWDEVLAHPGPIEVTTLFTGTISMDRGDNLDPDVWNKRPFPDQRKRLVVMAHLLRHERLGDVLVDAGFDKSFAGDPPYGSYSVPMALMNRVMGVSNAQAPGQDLAAQLASRGANPRQVFFTHLHPDHTAGVRSLPAQTALVFGNRELGFLARVALGDHFEGKPDLRVLNFDGVSAMAPLGPAIDLLGDGSLWAVSTAGHTEGQVSYLVNARSGPVLLLGDASHFGWAFANHVPPRAFDSEGKKQARASLEQLIAFAALYPQVKVIFGHEMPEATPAP